MSTVAEPPVAPVVPTPEVAAAPAATEPQKDEGRDYVVLKRVPGASPNDPVGYVYVGIVPANSAEQAGRKTAEDPQYATFLNAEGPTTFVAVPSRSFTSVTLEVQVSRRIIVS